MTLDEPSEEETSEELRTTESDGKKIALLEVVSSGKEAIEASLELKLLVGK